MKTNKTFTFQGLDFKTELRLSLSLIIPLLLIIAIIIIVFNFVLPEAYFLYMWITIAGLTLTSAIFLAQVFMKTIKEKTWEVTIDKEDVQITFRKNKWNFELQDIRIIKNMGNFGLRYLTIITKDSTLKIRVGNTGLAPFSRPEDIDEVDRFIEYLKPYIDQNFNKKILKNMLYPDMFPNCGVYVVKTEKIKYNIAQRMNPNQYLLIFGLGGMLIVFLFVCIVAEIIDYIISK